MVDVHPTPSHAGKVGGFLQQSTAGLPNWAWLLVIAGGITAAIIVPKFLAQNQTSANSTTPTSASGLGLAVDPTTGLPYAVEGLVPSGGTVASSGPPPIPTTPAAATPMPTTTYTTRGNITSGAGAGTSDIPVRSSPGGQVVGNIPFGTRVTTQGPAVTGPNNFGPGNTSGSTDWYPVQGGYVSGFDIQQAAGSTGPSWPGAYLRSRHMRIA